MDDRYAYQQLPPDHIRVIRLLPATREEPISISIATIALDERAEYEALSYTWGPQHPASAIICGTTRLQVGPHLEMALRALRLVDVERTLWIDRIAINQDDIAEREQQVGIMGQIYRQASCVLIWLGAEDADTRDLFESMDNLGKQIITQARADGLDQPLRRPTNEHSISYPPRGDAFWHSFRELLGRAWFSRIWTFQEIFFAKKAVLICGQYQLQWVQFELLVWGLVMYQRGLNYEDKGAWIEGSPAQLMVLARRASTLVPADVELAAGLMHLLDSLRMHAATDPRDKVYALLGVASNVSPGDFEIDYRKSPMEVYATTAKWLIKHHNSLDALMLVEKKDKPDLVSWIPDFRYKDGYNFMHQPGFKFTGDAYRRFRACGSAPPLLKDEPLLQLTVRGIHVGIITARTEPPGNVLPNNQQALGPDVLEGGRWPAFASGAAVDGRYPHTGEPIQLAYQRACIWDTLPGDVTERRRRTQPLTHIPQPGELLYGGVGVGVAGRMNDISGSILNGTTRKRMFITDTRYLGLARRHLVVGDQVFVLMGFDTPVLLRRIGGNMYSFEGEAYVHGIMDGELLAKAKAAKDGSEHADLKKLAWIETLDENWQDWPFNTMEMVLV